MKQFFKMFFASLLAMVVTGVIIVFGIVSLIVGASKSFTEKEEQVAGNSILVLDLSKRIHESGQSNSLAILDKGSSYEAGLYDVTKALSKAGSDNDVKGLLIKLSPSPNGWATLQQVRTAIKEFKAMGKPVFAYGENITQGAYYVATAADSIYLNPAGSMELKGFATVLAFFKGALEKLEIQPEIFYAGKFKSATEPFRAYKISDPNREQLMAMQNGLWSQFLAATNEYTHLSTQSIHQLAVDGSIQFPTDALHYKLIAGVCYWDEVEAKIRVKTGLKPSGKITYQALGDYASAVKQEGEINDTRIAVLIAEGEISDGEQQNETEIASQTFVEEIRKVAENNKIKAVVLRVNSPGGSALASDVILRELTLLKKKKPLVVSMGDYAASGGYYISCKADSIFAMPNTITGSIGVFGMMFNIDKMMKNKLGITFDGVKNAPFADVPTVTRPLDAREAQLVQNSVDTIYSLFKGHVVAGRRLTKDEVDSISQGRIWTGTDALRLHLIDRIGGLSDAITSAAQLAHVTGYKVVVLPEAEDKLEVLMRKFKNNASSSAMLKEAIKAEMPQQTNIDWYTQLKRLTKMNRVPMAAMPFVPETN